jgi:hypothetical protein
LDETEFLRRRSRVRLWAPLSATTRMPPESRGARFESSIASLNQSLQRDEQVVASASGTFR